MVAVELLPELKKAAKERQRAGGGDKKSGSQLVADPIEDQGKASQQAADLVGTNRQYVWSMNGARRHLSASQRAAVAVELLPELKKAAKEREHRGKPVPLVEQGRSHEQAADLVGVGKQYVNDAEKIKEADPDLFEEIKAGTKTVKREVVQSIELREFVVT